MANSRLCLNTRVKDTTKSLMALAYDQFLMFKIEIVREME